MIERHPVAPGEMHPLRQVDVTASQVGGLFDVHPYTTRRKMFLEKIGRHSPDQPDNKVLRRGRLLESAVAEAVMEERPQWRLEKSQHYYRDPAIRLGCTPDYYVHGDERGLGVIQLKTVHPLAFRKSWKEHGAPLWIALQNAVEMMLVPDVKWGAIGALISADPFDCYIYDLPKVEGAEKRIREAVVEFWDAVAIGMEPEADYAKEAALIASLYPKSEEGKSIDLSGDNRLPMLLEDREKLKARIKADTDALKPIEAEIKDKIGDAEVAALPGYSISFKTQERAGYTVKPSSMRVLRITNHNPKGEDHDAGEF